MVGTKKKNVYRKKRKGKEFSGIQKQAKRDTETTEIVSPTTSTSRECSDSDSESKVEGSIGASRKKMKLQSSPKESYPEPSKDQRDVFQGQGYRLVDLERFSSTLSEAHVCEEGTLILQENENGRRGLMTELSAQCSSCLEESPLETSFVITKRRKSLDVNRRAVYHSLETGGGYEGLASFCSIMNMPCLSKPAYYQHVDAILNALELEAQEEMKVAGQKSDLQASKKDKKRRQAERLRKTRREDALRDAEDTTYEAGAF